MPMSVAHTWRIFFFKSRVCEFGYHSEHPCNWDNY